MSRISPKNRLIYHFPNSTCTNFDNRSIKRTESRLSFCARAEGKIHSYMAQWQLYMFTMEIRCMKKLTEKVSERKELQPSLSFFLPFLPLGKMQKSKGKIVPFFRTYFPSHKSVALKAKDKKRQSAGLTKFLKEVYMQFRGQIKFNS